MIVGREDDAGAEPGRARRGGGERPGGGALEHAASAAHRASRWPGRRRPAPCRRPAGTANTRSSRAPSVSSYWRAAHSHDSMSTLWLTITAHSSAAQNRGSGAPAASSRRRGLVVRARPTRARRPSHDVQPPRSALATAWARCHSRNLPVCLVGDLPSSTMAPWSGPARKRSWCGRSCSGDRLRDRPVPVHRQPDQGEPRGGPERRSTPRPSGRRSGAPSMLDAAAARRVVVRRPRGGGPVRRRVRAAGRAVPRRGLAGRVREGLPRVADARRRARGDAEPAAPAERRHRRDRRGERRARFARRRRADRLRLPRRRSGRLRILVVSLAGVPVLQGVAPR